MGLGGMESVKCTTQYSWSGVLRTCRMPSGGSYKLLSPCKHAWSQSDAGILRGTPGLIPLCTLQEWADVCCRGLRSVHAYILVYDICCFDSFEYIKTIRQQILETR